MRVFLDTSVILSACGSSKGASSEIFRQAPTHGWKLIVTPYVIQEVENNLIKLPGNPALIWARLRADLIVMQDVVTLDRPTSFEAGKDRPILFGALAWADALLTVDKGDFGSILGGKFYDLPVLKPGDFLERERTLGRL